MTARPSTELHRRALKLATKASLLASGTAAAVVQAGLVRVKEAALSFCASPKDEHADRFVGIDTALDLDFCAGEPIHARALAAAQGYELRPVEPVRSLGAFAHSDIRRLSREVGDLAEASFAALDDGVVCRNDRLAMLAEIADVEREIAIWRAKLESAE